LKLIDPYLTGGKELDNDAFYRLTHNSIVVRRTKMDVNEVYEHREIFKKARFVARVIGATPMEVEFNELLFQFLRDKLLRYYKYVGEEPKALPLLLALIAKRASSSPFAAMKTLERILRRRSLVVEGRVASLADASKLDEEAESIVEAYLGLGFEDYDEIGDSDLITEPDEYINKFVEDCTVLLDKQDIEVIERLFNLAQGIVEHGDSRLKGVFKLISEHLRKGDRIVVFTEYKDTAQYIYKKLREEIPNIANESALITSDGIYIPGWDRREKPGIEHLKQYLRRGLIKLIISTDVASEGLNLQVANVIMNYEPSWSPVKIEQRLGRVWRLGQEKEVTSYTLFLAIKSDNDALDILYKKLLAWGRSLQETRTTIGEEVVIDMMREEGPITIPIDVAKRTPSYSEYKALLTYIRDGRSGLERYVQSIINALLSLRKSLETVGLTRRSMTHKIEKILSDVLGDFRGSSVDELFKELFITTAKLREISVKIEGNKLFAGKYTASNTYELYSNTVSILQGVNSLDKPIYVVSSAQLWDLKELHLFQVTILFEKQPVYSETVGVCVKPDSIELLRGRKLVETVIKALSPDYIVANAQEYSTSDSLIQQFKAIVSSLLLNKVAPVATEEFINYVTKLEELNFSFRHTDWKPGDMGLYHGVYKYIGAIIFTTPHEGGSRTVPPIKVKEVEEIATKMAMEYERKSGRIPQDVSMNEHFDILSRNPQTGEIRFIEVKGRSGLDLEIELTEPEFKVAQEKGTNYWLYIVYGISTGYPRLLAVQDPIRNMVWSEVMIKRYKFKPR